MVFLAMSLKFNYNSGDISLANPPFVQYQRAPVSALIVSSSILHSVSVITEMMNNLRNQLTRLGKEHR
jgi:hypothetical protein